MSCNLLLPLSLLQSKLLIFKLQSGTHAPGDNIQIPVKLILKIVQTILYPLHLDIFLPLLNSKLIDSIKVLLSQAYLTFYSAADYQYCKKHNTLHLASQNCLPFFRFWVGFFIFPTCPHYFQFYSCLLIWLQSFPVWSQAENAL